MWFYFCCCHTLFSLCLECTKSLTDHQKLMGHGGSKSKSLIAQMNHRKNTQKKNDINVLYIRHRA